MSDPNTLPFSNSCGVAVTGASGFIGKNLVRRLSNLPLDIRVLTRSLKAEDGQTKCFVADLLDEEASLSGFFKDIDVVFHCAGEVRNEALMYPLHVEGLARLFRELHRELHISQRPIHWVQLSSVGAYGMFVTEKERVVTEESLCEPVGAYEVSKTQADELLMEFAAKEPLFSFTILRPSNVVGRDMTNSSFDSLIKMIKKRLFFYIGSKKSISTYVHVNDVVDALMLCGKDERAAGHIFNLSNDCKLSEIVDKISEAEQKKSNFFCFPERLVRLFVSLVGKFIQIPLTQTRVNSLVNKTRYPSTKIRDVLGFSPKYDIPEEAVFMLKDCKSEKRS